MSRRALALMVPWGLAGPLLALILALVVPGFLTELELKTTDLRVRLLGPAAADPRVVLIGLDDESLQLFGKWPWPRELHAQLIRRLHGLGAAAIAYDIFFAVPSQDPGQDQELAKAMAEAGGVVFPFGCELSPPKPLSDATDLTPESFSALEPFLISLAPDTKKVHPPRVTRSIPLLPGFLAAAAGVGHISSSPDPDGVFRRLPMVVRVRDQILPALSLSALSPLKTWDLSRMKWEGRFLVVPPKVAGHGQPLRLPLDENAGLMINWTGTQESTANFSARFILDPTLDPKVEIRLKRTIPGAICFVGLNSSGSGDIGPQPFETQYPLVGAHANMINTLLRGGFREQSGLAATIFYLLFLTLLAIGLGFISRPWLFITLGGAVFLGWLAYSLLALAAFNTFVPVLTPELSFVVSGAAIISYRLTMQNRELRFLREHFVNVLPPAVLDQLLRNPQILNRKSERKELTVMFTDIKGFTQISDREQAEVVYEMLTEYFEAMTEIIFRYGGTIDKFMGDGILAFWGAPLFCENSALDAVLAGIEMQATVARLSAKWESMGRPGIRIRIGVNTGYMSVGFFGSSQRREYTVIGSSVNMGQRLEANCRPGHLLVSKRTYGQIKDQIPACSMGAINLKGFAEQFEVFEVECPKPGAESGSKAEGG